MAYIQNIGLAKAPFKHNQQDILQFALDQYKVPDRMIDKVERLYERCEINTRYSAIEDFSLTEDKRKLFKKGETTSIQERMDVYFKVAPALCKQAVQDCLQASDYKNITHLITVSCTGMAAPGLDILLIESLGLANHTQRTSVNFMGCYAGFHALKMANAICAEHKNAQVLIVDVELCTLHFQHDFSMDNVAASLLFADGAAATLVSNNQENSLFKIHSFYSELAPEGQKDMAWHIGDTGFLMTLSGYVPSILSEYIAPLLSNAIANKEEIKHWAIHPGGKKIITEIAKALKLTESDVQVSRDVLLNHGNMSSATIFFVLDALLKKDFKAGEKLFATGFGPGLTIESAILSFV